MAVRQKLVNNTRNTVENLAEPEIGVAHLPHIDNPHSHHFSFVAGCLDDSIAHDVGPRVNPEYDFLGFYHLSMYGFVASSIPIVVEFPCPG